MGYRTVQNVKRCFTYADAKYYHDNTKPIRGRSPEKRPLGDRRDVDTYSIRMNGEDVEFVLYHTPVITYKPNGDVVVKTDGWSSVSTHQFIVQVLFVSCYGSKGNTVIEAHKEGTHGERQKFIIPKHKSITMLHAGGRWHVTQSHSIHEYRLNPKAAREVRKRYADFINYAKGMAKLRAEPCTPHKWSRRSKDFMGISRPLRTTPKLNWGENISALIDSSISEEQKHEKYYEVFERALFCCEAVACTTASKEQVHAVPTDTILSTIDDLLLRTHAEEVLVWTELQPGQVPVNRYKAWMPERA